MKGFNEFQNENFEKGVMLEKKPKHGFEEGPKHEVEKRPRHEVEEGLKHEVEKGPKHEGQGSIEEKINFIINFSTDKTQLLELKKILVELEFYGKKEEKGIQDNDEKKIRRR